MDLIKQEDETESSPKLTKPDENFEAQHKIIYRSSKVFQRLQQFINNCEFDTSGEPNKFYNPSFASEFLKCHLSYILLWANPMTAIRDPSAARANNGIIENSFNMKKREVRENKFTLGSFGKIKIGRFVKFASDIVDLRVKKILMNIPAKVHPNKKNPCQEHCETENGVISSKEMYRKRSARERTRSTFFTSKSSSSSESRTQSQPRFPKHSKSSKLLPRRSSSLSSNIESD